MSRFSRNCKISDRVTAQVFEHFREHNQVERSMPIERDAWRLQVGEQIHRHERVGLRDLLAERLVEARIAFHRRPVRDHETTTWQKALVERREHAGAELQHARAVDTGSEYPRGVEQLQEP